MGCHWLLVSQCFSGNTDPTGADQSPTYIRQACEASLRRLQVETIDLYQFHNGGYDPERAAEVRETLEALVTEGKIRYYGWSTDSPERARVFAEGAHCTSVQHQMNVLNDNAPMRALCDELDKAESTLRNELTQQPGYKLGLKTAYLIMKKTRDLAALDRQAADLVASGNLSAGDDGASGWTIAEQAEDDPGWGTQANATSQSAGGPSGYILGTAAVSDTFRITVTVRFAGPGHLLYEPPILTSGLQGNQATYYPTQASLQQAHLDFLNLVTGGEATSALTFRPVPPANEGLTLIFNPNHQPGDLVAPRWEMSIRGGGR